MPTRSARSRRKIGRPPFEPTEAQRQLVKVLTASGHVQDVIGARVGCNKDTLRRHFRAEIDEGVDFANSAVGEKLLQKALSGDIKAIENWLDRRGGLPWRKVTGSEHSGPGGAPFAVAAVPRRDLSHLSDDEAETLHRLLSKAEGQDAAAVGR